MFRTTRIFVTIGCCVYFGAGCVSRHTNEAEKAKPDFASDKLKYTNNLIPVALKGGSLTLCAEMRDVAPGKWSSQDVSDLKEILALAKQAATAWSDAVGISFAEISTDYKEVGKCAPGNMVTGHLNLFLVKTDEGLHKQAESDQLTYEGIVHSYAYSLKDENGPMGQIVYNMPLIIERGTDVAATTLHEFGHLFGLLDTYIYQNGSVEGRVEGQTESVMGAYRADRTVVNSLQEDDKIGVRALAQSLRDNKPFSMASLCPEGWTGYLANDPRSPVPQDAVFCKKQ